MGAALGKICKLGPMLGHSISGAWEKLISKTAVVNTDDDSELLRYFI